MNVIAVTAWRRPEFLAVYLDQLKKNKELPNYLVHFFVEVDPHEDTDTIINRFKEYHGEDKVRVTYRTERKSACPAAYNIMDSYRIAVEEASEYVLLGEEDIVPSQDYLRFCERAYNKFLKPYDNLFCVAHKRRQDPQDGHSHLLMGDTQCTSPMIVSVEDIKKYMLPLYSLPYYFSNPIVFNSQHYPHSRINPGQHYDHDGQIERIIEKNGLFALKPDQARTAHIGFYGGVSFEGMDLDLDEKIEIIKAAVFDEEKLNELHSKYDKRALPTEIATCDLKDYEWDDLELDLDRDRCISSSWWYDPENTFKEYME
tara:strand:- start:1166 stop:2107 length:942 start_codon:yes stop_codon:yes gene_type:complete